jgi:hypothetical protein
MILILILLLLLLFDFIAWFTHLVVFAALWPGVNA